jgi:Tol biopolymer transport system component
MKLTSTLIGLLVLAGCLFGPSPLPEPEEGEASVTQVTSGRSGEDKDPELAPDGKTLYYVSSSFGDRMDLYMKTLGTSTATRLTNLPGDKRFPRVNRAAPRYLAFSTNARGSWEIAILDVQGDPSHVQFVSEPDTQCLHPSWSPDGRMLVYCSSTGTSAHEWTLRIRDFVSGRSISLEDVDGLLPQWSPQGNRIVFQRMKHRDQWFSALWTLEFEGGTAKNLTVLFSNDDWAAINPCWSPDGRHVVFATVGKSKARSGILTEGDDIWMVDADGSHPCQLTTRTSADWMPAWGVNGLIFFVSNRSGTNRIWSLKAPVSGTALGEPRSTLETAEKPRR